MFIWKVEEMLLMNDAIRRFHKTGLIYSCENSISREDKIAFVDSMTDGRLSYILNLIEKFNEDSKNLPHTAPIDGESEVKTVSLKAWLNRNNTNDIWHMVDNRYHFGQYNILGCIRNIQSSYKDMYDYYDDLVDEVFHRQLKECEQQERVYFQAHDEYAILTNHVKEKQRLYNTTFGVNLFIGSECIEVGEDSNHLRKLTKGELKELISKYNQIDMLVDQLTTATNIV